jgi:uncharacterized membrane protein
VSWRTRLWLGGLAAGGVVVAHVLAFLLVAPNPLQRGELLEATGHGAWRFLLPIAMGAVVVALAGFASGRSREDRPTPPAALFRGTAGRLVTLQLAAFLLLEALERLAAGHGLTDLLREPVIAIGLVAQVLVALVGAALLVMFARLLDRLVQFLRIIPRAPRVLTPRGVLDGTFPRIRIATGPVNPRGPPRRT